MKRFTVILAILVISLPAMAEDSSAKVVRVTGTAEIKVAPDHAVIELGVEKQSASASLAKQSADDAARKILATLHAGGVDEKDIQTTFLYLRPQFSERKGVRTPYFVAAQTLTVTIRDLSRLDSLLQSLIQAGGNEIDSIHYETSDLRKYRDDARERAVKAAREKAQALAAALGQEIGKAQTIEEVAEPYGYMSNTAFEAPQRRALSSATSPGENTITASVVVAFELN